MKTKKIIYGLTCMAAISSIPFLRGKDSVKGANARFIPNIVIYDDGGGGGAPAKTWEIIDSFETEYAYDKEYDLAAEEDRLEKECDGEHRYGVKYFCISRRSTKTYNVVLGVATNLPIEKYNQKFTVNAQNSTKLSYTTSNTITNTTSETWGQNWGVDVEAKIPIKSVELKAKAFAHFSHSTTETMTTSYSSGTTQEISKGISVSTDYYSDISSGVFALTYEATGYLYQTVVTKMIIREEYLYAKDCDGDIPEWRFVSETVTSGLEKVYCESYIPRLKAGSVDPLIKKHCFKTDVEYEDYVYNRRLKENN